VKSDQQRVALADFSHSVQSAARMKVYDLRADQSAKSESILSRRYSPDPKITNQVATILAAVRQHRDAALIAYAERFDKVALQPSELRVTDKEIETATTQADLEFIEAFHSARANIEEFAKNTRRADWKGKNAQGAIVGERFDPFRRVGIYVPAGTAPLVSTAVMTVSLAKAAAVSEIAVTTPVGPAKTIDNGLLAALHLAGATEIYKVGGAQAIAALAFGTETIRPVYKIFGPGNPYVTEAKRQVFGHVAVDLMPGPSEILIIADHSAEPRWIAADLLAQAEHGPGSVICLIALTEGLIERVQAEIEIQIESLNRKNYLREVLENGASFVLAKSGEQAVRIANEFAPEHLSLMTEDSEKMAKAIFSAGAIFVGNFSPVVVGDFVAGPSHVLPTGGAGKSFSGLTVDQFQRRTSLVRYDRDALERSVSIVTHFSAIEQLDAHGRSVAIRFK
jgi:histidinol dehydrogenase